MNACIPEECLQPRRLDAARALQALQALQPSGAQVTPWATGLGTGTSGHPAVRRRREMIFNRKMPAMPAMGTKALPRLVFERAGILWIPAMPAGIRGDGVDRRCTLATRPPSRVPHLVIRGQKHGEPRAEARG